MPPPPSTTQVRVRYEETDSGGVVYHSNYLIYFEVGRTEFLRQRGTTYRQMEERGIVLAVVDVGATFRHPAVYDDLLDVSTRVTKIGRASVRFEYEITRDGRTLCTGFTVLACVDRALQVQRLPDDLRALLT